MRKDRTGRWLIVFAAIGAAIVSTGMTPAGQAKPPAPVPGGRGGPAPTC